jgi:hypothetical protein
MDDPSVSLEKSPGMLFVGEFYAGLEKVAAFLRSKLTVVRVIVPGLALTGKGLQIKVVAQGRGLGRTALGAVFYLRHRAHSS